MWYIPAERAVMQMRIVTVSYKTQEEEEEAKEEHWIFGHNKDEEYGLIPVSGCSVVLGLGFNQIVSQIH